MKKFSKYVLITAVALLCALVFTACGGGNGGKNGDNNKKGEPTQLVMSALSYDAGTEAVSWNKVTNASGYALRVGSDAKAASAITENGGKMRYYLTETYSGTYTVYVKALGDGENYTDSAEASKEITLLKILKKTVAVGTNHTLAIDESGNLLAWGANTYGQLGDGTRTSTGPSKLEVTVMAGTKFAAAAAGDNLSAAIDTDGNLWTWGRNDYGQLGNGGTNPGYGETIPDKVKDGTKFVSVSMDGWGTGYTSAAIDKDGNLWMWGRNDSGQLGNGESGWGTFEETPVKVNGTKFASVSSGRYHTLAIGRDGNLWAWGQNTNGQVGDGTTADKNQPVKIKGDTKFTAVSAGSSHSLAIDTSGNLWIWGQGTRLGMGAAAPMVKEPTEIPAFADKKFKLINASGDFSLAVDADGKLWTWDSNAPSQFSVLEEKQIVAISAGQHSFAIDKDGKAWAWGVSGNGELDNGVAGNPTAPVAVKTDIKFSV